MYSETTQQHLARAIRAVAQIVECENILDRVFYSKRTMSIAPPPEQFFHEDSYTAHIYEEVEKAKQAYEEKSNSSVINYPDDYSVVIGNRIRERREKMGLTQKDLSELTNIRRPNIARLERGATLPNLSTLVKISVGLQISMEELLKFA